MIRTGLGLIACLLAAPAAAQDADDGAVLFQQYCATCHGLDAGGGGPMAAALILQPPDLTKLSARNADVFPTARTAMRIDGREPIVSHGSPMPVFGRFFEGNDTAIKAETGQPIMTSRPVADLIAYLEGIQAE